MPASSVVEIGSDDPPAPTLVDLVEDVPDALLLGQCVNRQARHGDDRPRPGARRPPVDQGVEVVVSRGLATGV